MRIQDYIDVLRRRGWIIILALLLTSLSAYGFSKLQQPVYRASVEVAIEPARPDFGLTQSAKLLLRSYANRMSAEKYAAIVIDQLNLTVMPGALSSKVKVVADDSLLVIKVEADDGSGPNAVKIVNTWAHLFEGWREEQNARVDKDSRVFASIIDEANEYHQVRPKTLYNVAAGGVFGLTLGIVIVFILEWLQAGVVHDPKRLEFETGLTVLGVIPPLS